VEDTLLHLAKCCNPIPGDKIIGFVTRGRGVTIHAEWCKSLQAVEPERLIEAYWLKNIEGVFGVPVSVRCVDEPGVLAKVTKAIADKKVNIASISTKNLGDRVTEVRMVLEVEGQEQLDAVMRLLSKTKGVIGVTRIRQSGSV
jgi:guanosine-3',5'-bis(diphosphate) 3'-pyrophosphohydrolase